MDVNDNSETVAHLGPDLTETLTDLTENYRIAFGSYIHPNDAENFEIKGQHRNAPKYVFQHHLNFTHNIDDLITTKVNKPNNMQTIDNFDAAAGLDGLMQVLLCNEEIGWSENARKIVLLVTDSPMHTAGDGLLSGAVEPNPGICFVDSEGRYSTPLKYDYPSVRDVDRQLKKRKIYIIMAAKRNCLDWYTALHRLIPEATYVAKLRKDSANLIQSIRKGYYQFTKRTTLYLNATRIEGVETEFFADCHDTGVFNKTNTCRNMEEGKSIKLRVQLTLNRYQTRGTVKNYFYLR